MGVFVEEENAKHFESIFYFFVIGIFCYCCNHILQRLALAKTIKIAGGFADACFSSLLKVPSKAR